MKEEENNKKILKCSKCESKAQRLITGTREKESISIECVTIGSSSCLTHFKPMIEEDSYMLMTVLKGKAKANIGKKSYILTPDDSVLINPNILRGPEKIKNQVPTDTIILHIKKSLFKEITELFGIKSPDLEFKPTPVTMPPFLRHIMQLMMYATEHENEFGNTLLVDTAITQFIIFLLKSYPNIQGQDIDELLSQFKRDPRVQKGIEFLIDSYNKKVSIEELAKVSFLSKSHFLALFKKEIGTTPFEYLNQYRIKKACELLKDKNKSIEEISYLVGYGDSRYFREVFKSRLKVSPSEFRSTL